MLFYYYIMLLSGFGEKYDTVWQNSCIKKITRLSPCKCKKLQKSRASQ